MSNIVTFLAVSLLLTLTNAQAEQIVTTEINSSSINQISLSDIKLQLEIKKLEREIEAPKIEPYIQLFTLCIALVTVIISIWNSKNLQINQNNILNNQVEYQEKERISKLLNELGSNNNGVKISAIQSLNDYPNTHRFLVNVLIHETNFHVVDAIAVVLSQDVSNAVKLLTNESNLLIDKKLTLASKLFHAKVPKSIIIQNLDIDNSIFSDFLNSSRGKRAEKELGCSLDEYNNDSEELKLMYDESNNLKSSLYKIFYVFESVIRTASQNGEKLTINNAYLRGLILDDMNLSGWSFKGCNLQYASFKRAICENCDFSDTILNNSSFASARLDKSKFSNVECKSTSFKKAYLRNALFYNINGYDTDFRSARAENIVFTDVKFFKSKFAGFRGMKAVFEKAHLGKTNFIAADLTDAKFISTNLAETIFNKVQCDGAHFLAGTQLNQINHSREITFNEIEFEFKKKIIKVTPENLITFFQS